MFYYLSVIGILMTPLNQGIIENSVTGSFNTLEDCIKYKNTIVLNIIDQSIFKFHKNL